MDSGGGAGARRRTALERSEQTAQGADSPAEVDSWRGAFKKMTKKGLQ